jgi:SAM-dependent methyltransferase
MLTGSQYADDRHLRSRVSIYAYAETAPDPGWRTSLIPWDGTQIVADVGCGNGFDLRQVVPQRRCRHAVGIDLSAGMLRSLADLRQTGRLSLVQADAQHLPLPDGSVHVAMAMHMLYHVPDVTAASHSTSTRCSMTSPCRSNGSSRPRAASGPPPTWASSSAARPVWPELWFRQGDGTVLRASTGQTQPARARWLTTGPGGIDARRSVQPVARDARQRPSS